MLGVFFFLFEVRMAEIALVQSAADASCSKIHKHTTPPVVNLSLPQTAVLRFLGLSKCAVSFTKLILPPLFFFF